MTTPKEEELLCKLRVRCQEYRPLADAFEKTTAGGDHYIEIQDVAISISSSGSPASYPLAGSGRVRLKTHPHRSFSDACNEATRLVLRDLAQGWNDDRLGLECALAARDLTKEPRSIIQVSQNGALHQLSVAPTFAQLVLKASSSSHRQALLDLHDTVVAALHP